MGIAEKNNAQLYQHNGLTPNTCSILWLPVVYYGYLYSIMATCSLLQLPVVYYGYLQSTMATYTLLWLPVVYCGYLESIMAICSLLWLSVVTSCSLPLLYLQPSFSAAQSSKHNYFTMPTWPGLHYNSLYAAQSALPKLLSALLTHSCIPCLVSWLCLSSLLSFLWTSMPTQQLSFNNTL